MPQSYATLKELKQKEEQETLRYKYVERPQAEEGGTFLTAGTSSQVSVLFAALPRTSLFSLALSMLHISQALASLLGTGPSTQHGTERVHPVELPKLADYSSVRGSLV